jgi:hypothetical protein
VARRIAQEKSHFGALCYTVDTLFVTVLHCRHVVCYCVALFTIASEAVCPPPLGGRGLIDDDAS